MNQTYIPEWVIPVLRDKRLTIEAKGIYSYLCAFAGNGTTILPSIDVIVKQLNISKSRYYKYLKNLIDLNYIEITKEKIDGCLGRNIYEILPSPIPPLDEFDEDDELYDNEDK